MPFGLSYMPIMFMSHDPGIAFFLGRFVVVYFDDIIIFSRILKEYLFHLASSADSLQG